jgi:hypothetical protein
MKLHAYTLIMAILCAVVVGCAPQKMLPEGGETVPLDRVFAEITRHFQEAGVASLQTQASLKLEVQGEYYVLQGPFLYENPDSLRMRYTVVSLGPTVGEIIYTDGLLQILVPSEGKLYQGRLPENSFLFLTVRFRDYQDAPSGRFPTNISGDLEAMGLRFELRMKEAQINLPLPPGAFDPGQTAWKIYPLADLEEFIAGMMENRP